MTDSVRKQLRKAQQGELDAVLLYKKLSELVKDEEYKVKFKEVAADEGKHASILKAYTKETLMPKSLKANVIAMVYRVFGAKFTMNILAKGELDSIESYSPLVKDFPNIQLIMDDEKKHADIAASYRKKLMK